jgi:hypothetical protein
MSAVRAIYNGWPLLRLVLGPEELADVAEAAGKVGRLVASVIEVNPVFMLLALDAGFASLSLWAAPDNHLP